MHALVTFSVCPTPTCLCTVDLTSSAQREHGDAASPADVPLNDQSMSCHAIGARQGSFPQIAIQLASIVWPLTSVQRIAGYPGVRPGERRANLHRQRHGYGRVLRRHRLPTRVRVPAHGMTVRCGVGPWFDRAMRRACRAGACCAPCADSAISDVASPRRCTSRGGLHPRSAGHEAAAGGLMCPQQT